MIDLLVLGTGAMMPLPHRWLSSFLARCDGHLTLFDCGEGTQIPWRSTGWGFRRLSAICLSHEHADHVAGLPGILHSVANADRTEPVVIYGPVGIAKVVEGLRAVARHLPFDLHVHELSGGERVALPGGLTVTAVEALHRVSCLAYRVEIERAPRFDPEAARALGVPLGLWRDLQQGRPVQWDGGAALPGDVLGPPRPGLAFGFVTDTRPTAALAAAMSDVDLLICDGTYGDPADTEKAKDHLHMTFTEAATFAVEARAQALLLTHFSPAMTDPAAYLPHATAIFPASQIARTGLEITLSFRD